MGDKRTLPGLDNRAMAVPATAEWVLAWIAADEGQHIEFKLETETQPDITETLAAFANAEGGVVLFGVADDRTLRGVRDMKALTLRVWAAARSVNPRLDQHIRVDEVHVSGKRLLAVRVPDTLRDIYGASSVYRIRQGASNVSLTAQAIVHQTRNRGAAPYDRETVAGTGVGSFNMALLTDFIGRRGSGGSFDLREAGWNNQLRNLGIIGADGAATVAGLLMFGREPQSQLPQAVLQCARFQGTGVRLFLDRAELGGSVPQQIDAALDFMRRNTRHGTYIDGVRHVDVDEYPLPAIREALTNAVCHRDYYSAGVVNLSIFDDRIEVLNPGGLLPGLRPEELEGTHLLRNAVLGQLMYEAGLIERWGSGIRRMRQSMEEVDLPAPHIQATRDWFRIEFVGPGDAFLQPMVERPSVLVSPVSPTPAAPPDVPLKLNYRQRMLLSSFAPSEYISTSDYMGRFDVSESTALRDLAALVEWGLLLRTGEAKATRYMLSPAAGGQAG